MALKVLTVDDSKTIRMIVSKAFRPYDCELFEAENGVEGLALASREKPNLIVLDITMPVMNGIEMLGKMKAEASLKNIPVIMLTAESGKDNVMQIVKMGVKDYMVKPFKGEQLIERAKTIVPLEAKKAEESKGAGLSKYFTADEDVQRLMIPEKFSRTDTVELESSVQSKIKAMSGAGQSKMIMDLTRAGEVNMSLIKIIIATTQNCQKAKIHLRIAGNPSLGDELKGFKETSQLPVYGSYETAKGAFQ